MGNFETIKKHAGSRWPYPRRYYWRDWQITSSWLLP